MPENPIPGVPGGSLKPRLALNVGVTGHRPEKLEQAALGTLKREVETVLRRIAEVYAGIAVSQEVLNAHDQGQPPALRLLSALAEGADQIAAWCALDLVGVPCEWPNAPELRYELQCPLPFAEDQYRLDFPPHALPEFDRLLAEIKVRNHRVLELDGSWADKGTRDLAYWKVGRFVLRHADILLALWNGEEDKTSVGTAGVVAQAERDRVPTIRILTKAPYSIEFRDYELTGDDWKPLDDGYIRERLLRLVLPPDRLVKSACETLPDENAPDNLRSAYFAHNEPELTRVADRYRRFFAKHGKRNMDNIDMGYQQGSGYQWAVVDKALSDMAQCTPVPSETELQDKLKANFLQADQLATYYADEYRGTYLSMFTLGSVAVGLALLSGPFKVFESFGHWVAELMPWLAFGELFVIGRVFSLWRRCHDGQFHQRWLDFRLLAELLRQRIFLLPIGGIVTLEMPDYEADSDRSYGWVLWLTRALSRAEGLPAAPAGGFNDQYRLGYGKYLVKLLCDQAKYHESNAQRNDNIAHHLHAVDKWLVRFIVLACLTHIFAHISELLIPCFPNVVLLHDLEKFLPGIMDVTVIFAALLPAVGATEHGLFSHGEYRRISDRSKGMSRKLKSIVAELTPTNGASLTAAKLENLAEQANEIMRQELTDWRVIFRAKPLEPSL